MALPLLNKFSLVGGTALSLRYGHRTSIDLDLFTHENFENTDIVACLEQEFGSDFSYNAKGSNFGVFGFIAGVKLDVVRYPHLPIEEIEVCDGIRMYSDADIAAMKVQAILGRGKKKDFWDMHELLKHYSVQQVMDWHKKKYPNQMLAISIPYAMLYFADADESETPVSLTGQTWESVKKAIQQKVSEYLS